MEQLAVNYTGLIDPGRFRTVIKIVIFISRCNKPDNLFLLKQSFAIRTCDFRQLPKINQKKAFFIL